MQRLVLTLTILFAVPATVRSEERFVTIHQVAGNRLAVVESPSGNMRGRGMQGDAPQGGDMAQAQGIRGGRMRGGAAGAGGPRSRAAGNAPQTITVVIPADAKITAAMRERRTNEFRVGIELAGGMRHPVFTEMQRPLAARIVTQGNRITELNVITEDTDPNQRNASSSGQTVIAVKPKRPPSK